MCSNMLPNRTVGMARRLKQSSKEFKIPCSGRSASFGDWRLIAVFCVSKREEFDRIIYEIIYRG